VIHLLEALGRRAAPILAVSLFVGLLLPDLAARLRPMVAPALIGLMVCNVVRIDWRKVAAIAALPMRALPLLLWVLLAVPLLTALVLAPLPLPAELKEAILLTASSPVLTAVPTFVLMMDLDGALALFAVIASSLLQPLVQPPIVYWLLGVELDLPLGQLMMRLALFVGAGFAIGLAARAAIGAERVRRWDRAIGGAAVALLVVFGIGVMDGTTALIIDRPALVLLFLAAGLATNFLLQFAGIAAFWAMERRAGMTIALTGGCRNLANLVAVLGPAASPELALFLAVGQFPLYFVPALFGPIYRRLAGRDAS
jgi:BASS family bile acid:Na+ symporter